MILSFLPVLSRHQKGQRVVGCEAALAQSSKQGLIMPYIVRAWTAAGDSIWEFDEALGAVKKATELLGNGVKDLTVEAPDGETYREVDLADMLIRDENRSA